MPAGGAPRRVLLLGGSGTIGQATAHALLARGHRVVGLVRAAALPALSRQCPGVQWRAAEVTQPDAVARHGLHTDDGVRVDAVLSCLASRSGVPAEAWAVDHGAHHHALQAARQAGVPQFVLLSAICVQRPRLAFQHAKLAFEQELVEAGLQHVIVRPTAFFKSLSGQVARVQRGQPFLLFGDGRQTACRPLSDADLARYLVDCLDDPARQGRILPIGGPGPAITPREQGELLFELTGRAPRFRSVPPGLLAGVGRGLGLLARAWPRLAAAAELARIGHYYATESMLVWDTATGRYSDAATPATGRDTLRAHYQALLAGTAQADRGAHAVF